MFAAYLHYLDIVHRVGRLNLNVNMLSQLPQSPPDHDLPVIDHSHPLLAAESTTTQALGLASPLGAGMKFATPTYVHLSWGDVLTGCQESPASSKLETEPFQLAFAVTHFKAKESRESAPLEAATPEVSLLDSLAREQAPSTMHLLIRLSPEWVAHFVQGYAKDPFFQERWRCTGDKTIPLYVGQCYFCHEDGLLFLQNGPNPIRLCVPQSEAMHLIAHLHNFPSEAPHEGALKLAHRLVLQFYWPKLLEDVQVYMGSCNVCQKIKHIDRPKWAC